MLANIFFSTLNHVAAKMPLIVNVVSKLFVVGIVFTSTASSQNRPVAVKFATSDNSEIAKSDTRPRLVKNETSSQNSELLLMERKAFDLLNQKRIDIGNSPLVWSENIAKVARLHSSNMASYKFFSHSGLDGLTVDGRADSLGFKKWRAIGENIAYNRGFDNPVEFTVERWMLSASHKKNLLDSRWKEAAVGIAKASDDTYYFTEVFMEK
jgi:uncharacterized protein YkwD